MGLNDKVSWFHDAAMRELDSAWNYAVFLSEDHGIAATLVEDTYTQIARSPDAGSANGLRASILKTVRDCHRAKSPQPAAHSSPVRASVNPADVEPSSLPLRDAIPTLAQPVREILLLRETERLTYKEIADVIDTPVSAVLERLVHARRELANSIRRRVPQGAC